MKTYSTPTQYSSIDINIVVDKCMDEINTYSEEKKEQLRKAYDNMLPDEKYIPPRELKLIYNGYAIGKNKG